ncbi:MAG: hypothetical protein WC840_06885, partial [Candidatus Peribacteraceae bacterium]
ADLVGFGDITKRIRARGIRGKKPRSLNAVYGKHGIRYGIIHRTHSLFSQDVDWEYQRWHSRPVSKNG